ncbi:MAG: OmpA family protein [Candidatus Aminicenantes bacterium]|nr:OmpA family protein [Candidatus Aminicenantes bacterium]
MKRTLAVFVTAALMLAGLSCASMNRTQKGAIIGGASGAVVGGRIGKAAGNTLLGAILGAAVGGAAGAFIGHYMDKQAAEMQRDLEGAKVERIGEGIKITFDSGLLFDVNRAELRDASRRNIEKLAQILQKYPDTNILIEGHTDSTGADDYNMGLSRERSRSVADYLVDQAVASSRCTVMGYGESQPIASNESVQGRQMNRRVDVAVMANEKLKKAAREKTQG